MSLPSLKAPKGWKRARHMYIKGVTERFGFDALESRKFNYLSKTKQRERLMGCLYTFLIGYLPFFGNIPLEVFYIFIGVGLSALLVSTDRGNAKAKIRGTGIRLAPRFFCIYMVMSQIS